MAQIHSVEAFKAMFRPGESFWMIQMDTSTGLPVSLDRHTVLAYEGDGTSFMSRQEGARDRRRSIRDCLNKWHGVFTTEDEGRAEFERRMNNPITPAETPNWDLGDRAGVYPQ